MKTVCHSKRLKTYSLCSSFGGRSLSLLRFGPRSNVIKCNQTINRSKSGHKMEFNLNITYSPLLIFKFFLVLHIWLNIDESQYWRLNLNAYCDQGHKLHTCREMFQGSGSREKETTSSSISLSCIPTRINSIFTVTKVSNFCQLILLTWGLMNLEKEK